MADENEILAIFKADIEQYKAAVAEMGATNKKAEKSTDAVTASTQKYEKTAKGAAGNIGMLSKGLAGVAGLLGVTGRLFGVNTDKIEALVFASKEFVRVGQDIIKASKLATAATVASTQAKVTEEVVTVQLTVAERILNAVRSASAGVIGLVVAGVALLVTGIYSYIQGLNEEEKAMKRKQDIDKEQIKINNQLTEQFNVRAKQIDETALAERVRLGKISERQAEEIKLNEAFFKQRIEDDKIIAKQRLDASLANQNAFGRLTFEDQKRIEENRIKLLNAAEADLEASRAALREKFAKEDADAKKKENEKSSAELEAQRLKDLEDSANFFSKLNEQNKKEIEDGYNEIKKLHFKAGEDSIKLFQEGAKKFAEENQDDAELLNEFGRTKEAQKKVDDAAEKRRLKRLEDEKMALDTIFSAQQEAFDKRQELLQQEVTLQEKNIDTQRSLAERGLENTLAFEEKRAAELQRQQQIDAQKQKRVKLLETFLNSLAEFSKTDPKTAISKALLQVALAQAASAVFAEEGGVIGEIGSRSNLSRKHRGGGDVLLHAQTGEGILPRDAMSAIGRRNFELLKNAGRHPVRDDIFGLPKIAVANGGMAISNDDVVKELKALRVDIKNQKRDSFDINKWGEYTRTTIENGVTELTKGKLKKPRFRV